MRVRLTVNGSDRTADDVWPGESLLFMLRERLGLPGTKNACEQGECGSCTVLLDGLPVCSCLVAAPQASGRDVVTVEGLRPRQDELDPVQQAFVEAGAVQCGFCTPGLIVTVADLIQPHTRRRPTPRSARRWPATCAAAPATRRSSTRCVWPPPGCATSCTLVIDGAAIATVDAAGHGVRRRPPDRRGRPDHRGRRRAGAGRSTGPGASTAPAACSRRGWSTPTTTSTSGRPGATPPTRTLFEWLTELYPVWAADRPSRWSARPPAAGLAWLALSGCTTSTDHHYVFPRGGGDLLGGHGGRRRGGRAAVPPDPRLDGPRPVRRAGCRRTRSWRASTRSWPRARTRCAGSTTRPRTRWCGSPSRRARRSRSPPTCCASRRRWPATLGVRLHTHLAETLDEEEFCRDQLRLHAGGVPRPARLARRRRVAGAHRPPEPVGHRPARRDRHRGRRTARRPTPGSAPAWPRPAPCSTPASRSVWAWTAPASQEAGRLVDEMRQALYVPGPARADGLPAGPTALTARQALAMATIGGARCLGRADEIGSLEPGKLADLALWRIDGLGHAGIADPVAALVFGSAPPLELLRSAARWSSSRTGCVTADERAADRRPAARLRGGAAHDRTPAATEHGGHPDAGRRRREPEPARRHAQGEGRVRLLLRPVARRHAVRRHAALPAPAGPDPRHRHLGRAGRARRATRC